MLLCDGRVVCGCADPYAKRVLGDTRQTPINDWFNPNFALRHEVRTIAAINGSTLMLTSPLSYDHRGARDANGAQTVLGDGTRLLPHVANLTRSITIRSASPTGTRGHTAYTSRAQVEIRNVAFRDLGRTTVEAVLDQDNSPNQIGRYPLHVHMLMGPVNPTNTGYQFQLTGNVSYWHTRHVRLGLELSHYITGGADNLARVPGNLGDEADPDAGSVTEVGSRIQIVF